MSQFLVFSHTVMGKEGLCITVGNRCSEEEVVQIRLKTTRNQPLKYSDFGDQAELIKEELRPGSVLEIDGFTKPSAGYRRKAHPEDRIIDPSKVKFITNLDWSEELKKCAGKMAYKNAYKLFPTMVGNKQYQFYHPAKKPSERSVGYVSAKMVTYHRDDYGKLRATVISESGFTTDVPVVGIDLVENYSTVKKSLVRLSLSGSYNHENWKETDHPERCSLMLSHVIEL